MDSCAINIYCCATWINPASQKQLLIIGAEEGIFTLDINNLASDESLKQVLC
jgi:hypothetical protein